MKPLLTIAWTLLLMVMPLRAEEQAADATNSSPQVKLSLRHPFRIFLTDEILLTHHAGGGSAVSHWTKQVRSAGNFEKKWNDHFQARVLDNGFLEVTNGTEVLLIPMEKVVSIRTTRDNKTSKAEQASSGQPATRSESKPEGGDKPEPEAEGRSR